MRGGGREGKGRGEGGGEAGGEGGGEGGGQAGGEGGGEGDGAGKRAFALPVGSLRSSARRDVLLRIQFVDAGDACWSDETCPDDEFEGRPMRGGGDGGGGGRGDGGGDDGGDGGIGGVGGAAGPGVADICFMGQLLSGMLLRSEVGLVDVLTAEQVERETRGRELSEWETCVSWNRLVRYEMSGPIPILAIPCGGCYSDAQPVLASKPSHFLDPLPIAIFGRSLKEWMLDCRSYNGEGCRWGSVVGCVIQVTCGAGHVTSDWPPRWR